MSEFSFLDYIDDFSELNLLLVEKNAKFKNRDEFADYVGFSKDTIKGWFIKKEGSSRKKIPTRQSWNLVLYELEARRKGFSSLADLFNNV